MKKVYLSIAQKIFKQLRSHVLKNSAEGAAFAYVKAFENDNNIIFKLVEWDPIYEDGFESRSEFHLSLTLETQGHVIKRAHDLQASLVEFHSHSGNLPVKFSESDFSGFEEFIPHVWWRLREKPYIAIVFNQTGFDGLVWIENPDTPQQLNGIIVGDKYLKPTKQTLQEDTNYGYGSI